MREAGYEKDNSENLTKDRKVWRGVVKQKKEYLMGWEKEIIIGIGKTLSQLDLNVPGENGNYQMMGGLAGGMGAAECASKGGGGRTSHERRVHRKEDVQHVCLECSGPFDSQAALTNLYKSFRGEVNTDRNASGPSQQQTVLDTEEPAGEEDTR